MLATLPVMAYLLRSYQAGPGATAEDAIEPSEEPIAAAAAEPESAEPAPVPCSCSPRAAAVPRDGRVRRLTAPRSHHAAVTLNRGGISAAYSTAYHNEQDAVTLRTTSAAPPAHQAAGVWLAIAAILVAAAILRLYNINWDGGQHLHPDERFLIMVDTGIHWPSNILQYFDSAHSPLNPYNNNFGNFVYDRPGLPVEAGRDHLAPRYLRWRALRRPGALSPGRRWQHLAAVPGRPAAVRHACGPTGRRVPGVQRPRHPAVALHGGGHLHRPLPHAVLRTTAPA